MSSLGQRVLVVSFGALIVLLGGYALLAMDLADWNDASAHVMRDNRRAMLDGRLQVALTRAVGESAGYAISGNYDYKDEAAMALQQAHEAVRQLRQAAGAAPPDEGSAADQAFLERQERLLRATAEGIRQANAALSVPGQPAASGGSVNPLSLIYAQEAEADALWEEIAAHHGAEQLRNEQTLLDHGRGAQFLMLAGVLAFALAAGLLIHFVRRRLVLPLTALAQLTASVAAGDLTVRTEVTRGDEIGQLQRSLNSMVDDLQKQRGELSALLDSLTRSRDAALASDQAKSRWLANVSHEIRTPLHGVLVSLDLMHEAAPDAEQRELSETARASARALLVMLNDLFDLSSLEAGNLPLDELRFEPRRVVKRMVELRRKRATDKGLVLDCRVADEVPASLCGDPLRIGQLLAYLLDNAIQFTESGSIDVWVSMAAAPSSPSVAPQGLPGPAIWLRCCVTDTGVGVPLEAAQTLFERFHEAEHTVSHGPQDIGLGLAIAHQLASRMGGELGFESEIGKGSSFWFTVPLKRGGLCEASVVPQAPATQHFPAGGSVLLVEDHRDNREVLARSLRRRGLTVTTAENGQVAVALARVQTFDLILMDCRMPVMDGFVATRAIRALDGERARVPIVALTAYGLTEPKQRYKEAGFDDLLVKPYALEDLEAALYRWLVVQRREADLPRDA